MSLVSWRTRWAFGPGEKDQMETGSLRGRLFSDATYGGTLRKLKGAFLSDNT